MRKPLDLTVWTRDENHPGSSNVVYVHDDGVHVLGDMVVDAKVRRKRLTDAELAAEYHQADVNFQRHIWQEMSRGEEWPDDVWERIAHPVNMLHRFATLPHYDEG